MSDDVDGAMRTMAVKRLKAQEEFKRFALTWIGLSVMFVVIWWFSSGAGSYFWPVWPILGVGIGVAFSGWGAYGPARLPKHLDEQAIEDQMRKMQGE